MYCRSSLAVVALLALFIPGCALDWKRDPSSTPLEDADQPKDAGALDEASQVRDGAMFDAAVTLDDAGESALDADVGVLADGGEAGMAVPCGAQACRNGSVCVSGQCQCPASWAGADCNSDVNECERADHGCSAEYPCLNLPGAYTCRGQFAEWPIPRRATAVAGFVVDAEAATVVDELTGLMWERNSAGVRGDFASAAGHCNELSSGKFAGFDDWRVPSFMELASLVTTPVAPSWDPGVFTDNPADDFWTATPTPPPLTVDPDSGVVIPRAVGFDMLGGVARPFAQSASLRTRCVRTVRVLTAVSPADRLDLSNNNLVIDRRTNLTWQRNSEEVIYFWGELDAFCQELRLAGLRWRLPTYAELLSLYDPLVAGFRPPPVFNGVPEGCFATSTVLAIDATRTAHFRAAFWEGGPHILRMDPSGDFQACSARCVHDPSM